MSNERYKATGASQNNTCGAIYGAGFRCGQGGVPRHSNPYPADDWRASVWLGGYDAGREQGEAKRSA